VTSYYKVVRTLRESGRGNSVIEGRTGIYLRLLRLVLGVCSRCHWGDGDKRDSNGSGRRYLKRLVGWN